MVQTVLTPSVIRYAIADSEVYDQITFVHVLPLNIYSDQCPMRIR